ncbi:hypothetical protein [Xenorhabdus szentirmaii]|uniref:hypothetical protein n=1 Tax=Xenorhabdus szentirmaii TaxID=290112 RepID=UPI000C04838F|nr:MULTISPECIES: hypothetical protein [Xenorhabdus]MBD2827171.1 hypothetical protein [Xenorhabdus sp. 5]PHM42395.1 hypothetical protein Xszus_02129 [Xenorhabdus szentirmaii]
MNNEFKNNTLDDISSRLKSASKVSKNYNINEITVDCDELIKLCDAAKKLSEYECIIGAYEQDNADWHKLVDRDGSAICRLVDIVLNLQSKIAEYESMEPVGFTNGIELKYVKNGQHGFIQVENTEKDFLPIPLYRHPNK